MACCYSPASASVPMMGLVAGVGAMLAAILNRLKLRVEALEKTPPRVMVSVKGGASR